MRISGVRRQTSLSSIRCALLSVSIKLNTGQVCVTVKKRMNETASVTLFDKFTSLKPHVVRDREREKKDVHKKENTIMK